MRISDKVLVPYWGFLYLIKKNSWMHQQLLMRSRPLLGFLISNLKFPLSFDTETSVLVPYWGFLYLITDWVTSEVLPSIVLVPYRGFLYLIG